MKVNNIIKKSLVSEKSTSMADRNRYMFEVDLHATKGLIADELKRMFGIDAIEVRTIIMPGKKKRIVKTNRFTKTAKRKKAIVTLKEGQKLDLTSSSTK